VNNQSDKNQDNNIHMLRYLEKKQEVSQRDIAQHLGISLGKVNYILNALVEKVNNSQNEEGKLTTKI